MKMESTTTSTIAANDLCSSAVCEGNNEHNDEEDSHSASFMSVIGRPTFTSTSRSQHDEKQNDPNIIIVDVESTTPSTTQLLPDSHFTTPGAREANDITAMMEEEDTRTTLSQVVIDVDDEVDDSASNVVPVSSSLSEQQDQEQQQAKEETTCCCRSSRPARIVLCCLTLLLAVIVFVILLLKSKVTHFKHNDDNDYPSTEPTSQSWPPTPSPIPQRTEAPTLEGIALLMEAADAERIENNNTYASRPWTKQPLVAAGDNCTIQMAKWKDSIAVNEDDQESTTQVLYADNVVLNADGTILAMTSLVQTRMSRREPWQTVHAMVQVFEYDDDDKSNSSHHSPGWTQRGQDLVVPLGGSVLALSGNGNTLVISSFISPSDKKLAANSVGQIKSFVYRDDEYDSNANNDGVKKIWNELSEPLVMTDAHFGQDLALNYDGTRLVVGQWTQQQVWVYDRQNQRQQKPASPHSGNNVGAAWKSTARIRGTAHAFGQQVDISAAGNRIVVLDGNQEVRTYELQADDEFTRLVLLGDRESTMGDSTNEKPNFSWSLIAPPTDPFQLGTHFSWFESYTNNNPQNPNREGVLAFAANGNHLAVGASHVSKSRNINRRQLKGRVRVWSWDTASSQWSRLGQEFVGPAGFGHDVHLSANGMTLIIYERRDDGHHHDSRILRYHWEAQTSTWVEEEHSALLVRRKSFSRQGTPKSIDVSVDGRVVAFAEVQREVECSQPTILTQ